MWPSRSCVGNWGEFQIFNVSINWPYKRKVKEGGGRWRKVEDVHRRMVQLTGEVETGERYTGVVIFTTHTWRADQKPGARFESEEVRALFI